MMKKVEGTTLHTQSAASSSSSTLTSQDNPLSPELRALVDRLDLEIANWENCHRTSSGSDREYLLLRKRESEDQRDALLQLARECDEALRVAAKRGFEHIEELARRDAAEADLARAEADRRSLNLQVQMATAALEAANEEAAELRAKVTVLQETLGFCTCGGIDRAAVKDRAQRREEPGDGE